MDKTSFSVPTELVTPGVMIVFAAGFVWAWTIDRGKSYPLFLSVACLLFAAGIASQVLHIPRGIGPNTLVSGAFFTLAVLVACEAILQRSGRTLRWGVQVSTFVGVMFLLWYYYHVENNLLARVYTQNFGYGFIFLFTAILLGWQRPRRTIDRVLFWILLIFAIHFFPRTVLTIGSSAPRTVEAFGHSAFWRMLQLSLGIFGASLALTVLAAILTDAMDSLRSERDKDDLTGVLNRRGFEDQALRLHDRRKTGHCALILCDLDRFKQINDSYGHYAGDTVLKTFGSILLESVRKQDLVGRVGGEEFMLLLPNTNQLEASKLAKRLGQTLKTASFAFLPKDCCITASFGIAEWREDCNFHDTYNVADRRLYAAKASGRDCIVISDDIPSIGNTTPDGDLANESSPVATRKTDDLLDAV